MKRNNDKFYYEIIVFDKFNNKKNYDIILIMINCLIKYFYIVFFKKKIYRQTIEIYRFKQIEQIS